MIRSNGVALRSGTLILTLAVLTIALQSRAQIYTMADQNSVAQIAPNSQAGMFDWRVQGQNELYQQWFWFALNNGPTHSIDTISPALVTSTAANNLTTSYAGAGYNVSVGYTLTGGSVVPVGQTGVSDIEESIQIHNTSASPIVFHFYQYSDFDLQNVPGPDTVTLSGSPRGGWNDAFQTYDGLGLTETITTPPANHAEAAPEFATLAKLNSGLPVVLNDNPTATGNVTWAFEWDLPINPGATALISKDKYLQVTITPEPSALALGVLGLAAWALRRRRVAV